MNTYNAYSASFRRLSTRRSRARRRGSIPGDERGAAGPPTVDFSNRARRNRVSSRAQRGISAIARGPEIPAALGMTVRPAARRGFGNNEAPFSTRQPVTSTTRRPRIADHSPRRGRRSAPKRLRFSRHERREVNGVARELSHDCREHRFELAARSAFSRAPTADRLHELVAPAAHAMTRFSLRATESRDRRAWPRGIRPAPRHRRDRARPAPRSAQCCHVSRPMRSPGWRDSRANSRDPRRSSSKRSTRGSVGVERTSRSKNSEMRPFHGGRSFVQVQPRGRLAEPLTAEQDEAMRPDAVGQSNTPPTAASPARSPRGDA